MTVNKPKHDASLFESIGGMKRLTKFANESDENFATVLKLLGPRIFEMGAGDNADKADPNRLEEFMRLHESVVQHRINHALAQHEAATSVTDDPSSGVKKPDEQHAISDTPKTLIEPPLVESKPVTPKPDVPLTPERARRRAMMPLPQPARTGPTSTELFLQYNSDGGGQRMNWSPPPGWSGG